MWIGLSGAVKLDYPTYRFFDEMSKMAKENASDYSIVCFPSKHRLRTCEILDQKDVRFSG